jgi:hypothetical protein
MLFDGERIDRLHVLWNDKIVKNQEDRTNGNEKNYIHQKISFRLDTGNSC